VKPIIFDYVAAESIDHAVAVLAEAADARALAGGQSLVPLMCQRRARPKVLVDLTKIAGLGDVVAGNGLLRIGATCRHRALERHADVRAVAPVVAAAAALAGPAQVRNRGTVGGSIAHADPAAELPAALLAAGASVRLAAHGGSRVVPLGELTLRPAEVVVGVDVPVADLPVGGAFAELAPREGDLPIAGAGCTVLIGGDGACAEVRLAACGVGSAPIDLSAAAAAARGERRPTRQLLARIATAVAAAVDPPTDARASAAQRREAVQMLALDALVRAWQTAGRPHGDG
jgi:aerobic carbon-monoxide dehydrogenase medium subunit